MRSSYTLANMYVRVTANTTVADSTLRSRIGAVDGALVVTVGGGLTGAFQDTVNSDSLVDGNLVNFSVVTPANVLTTSLVGFTMVNASGDDTVLVSNSFLGAGLGQNAGLTRYRAIGGTISTTGTESDQQYTVRSTATLSNLRAFVVSNSLSVTTTMRTRKNLGNGAQSVSILTLETGSFEDTVNTDSVAAGDEINYQIVTPAGAGTIATHLFQVKSAGTGRPTVHGFTAGLATNFADRFVLAEGGGTDLTAGPGTEAASQIAARSTFTASNLFVNVILHGVTGGVGFFLRLDGVNTALTLNVPDSTTGLFEDTTNTVNLISGNLYNHFVDHGGGVGDIEFPIIGFQNGPTAGLVPLIAGGYLPNIFDFFPEEPPVDFGPQGELYYWGFLLERPGAGEPIPTQPTTPTIGGRLREPTRR